MGFRFRKSIKLGPARINLSKSGIGYSFGGKGLRFTKKAGGGTRSTASIPGTGVSFVSDSGARKRKSTAKTSSTTPKKKKVGIWAAVIACFALIGSCGNDSSSTAPATEPFETSIIETTQAATEAVDAVTEATSQSADEMAGQATSGTTEAAEIPPEAPTTQPTTEQTEPEEEIHTYVLNTKTRKFHYEWCGSVDDMKEANKKVLETTREDVISRGYEPCGRCKP